MAKRPGGFNSTETNYDASLGLIFRLNNLWSNADNKALAGDIDGWNFVLDRIYCNLLYRNPLEATYGGEDGKTVTDVHLNEEAEVVYRQMRRKINMAKIAMKNALKSKNRLDYSMKKEVLYRTVMFKDIWLRKFMQELGLYLKEVEFNPATAMFGGGKY